jgi:hypothetical protein
MKLMLDDKAGHPLPDVSIEEYYNESLFIAQLYYLKQIQFHNF